MSPALLKFAECVEKSRAYKIGETGAFLGSEAVIVDVRARIRQINFRVRDVKVAAKNDWLFLFQLFQVGEKIFVPFLPIRQSREVALGIGNVNVHEKEIRKLGGEHAAFGVVLIHADVRRDVERFRFGENGRAGIAFAHGAIPMRFVMARPKLFHVVGRALDFLQAQNVRLLGIEKFQKIFLQHGAQAIDVP